MSDVTDKPTLSKEAKWLQDRILCCICLEIFDKPHTLPCLHSLCKACIDGLKPTRHEETNGYKCPVCDEFYQKQNVRHNFLIAELLEFYEMISTRKASAVCKQCGNEKPTHRCIECKADLCGPCKGFHDKFELMKTHHSVSLADIEKGIVIDKHIFCEKHPDELIKLNCVPCETPVCAVCKLTNHDGHKCESTADALNRLLPEVKQMQAKIQEDIKQSQAKETDINAKAEAIYKQITSMEDDVKKTHAEMQTKLNNDLAALLGELKTMRKDVEEQEKNCKAKVEQHVNDSTHVTEWVDTVTGAAQGTSLLQELQSGVRDKLKIMAQNVEKSREPLDASTKIEDNVSKLMFQGNPPVTENVLGCIKERNSGLWPFSFQTLCSSEPRCGSTVKLEHLANRWFGVVKDQIWIPVVNNNKALIMIHATDGQYIKTLILSDTIKTPRAVTEWRALPSDGSTPTIAIIASDSGLFAITENGMINATLQKGNFSDVCVVGDKVYALESGDESQIYIFQKSHESWDTLKTIRLKQCKPHIRNTLKVVNNLMYVYQYATPETMLKYSMDGELLGKYGEQESGEGAGAGQLYAGRLCGYDSAGSLLVCDRDNKRLQVLTADNQWIITNLKGLEFEPGYAAPLSHSSFCILDYNYPKLHIYTID